MDSLFILIEMRFLIFNSKENLIAFYILLYALQDTFFDSNDLSFILNGASELLLFHVLPFPY